MHALLELKPRTLLPITPQEEERILASLPSSTHAVQDHPIVSAPKPMALELHFNPYTHRFRRKLLLRQVREDDFSFPKLYLPQKSSESDSFVIFSETTTISRTWRPFSAGIYSQRAARRYRIESAKIIEPLPPQSNRQLCGAAAYSTINAGACALQGQEIEGSHGRGEDGKKAPIRTTTSP